MTLNVDLVSDFVCPWCYIGKARLNQAIADLQQKQPGLEVRLNWLPFFLNPDTPAAGEPYRAYLEKKFGGPREVDALHDKVAAAGAPDGVNFAFDRIAVRPNTLKAHRLTYRAQARGDTPERVHSLTDALFRAHFEEGRNIGDTETLADIAAACGDRREAVVAYLNGSEGTDAVKRMAEQVRKLGVTSVPFYIVDRQFTLSGAQSAAVLGAGLLQALSS